MDITLSKGTSLQKGKYTIVKSLGQGSFGITYLATTQLTIQGKLGQMDTTVDVAIKEFFMSEMNSRSKDGSSIEGSNGSLFSNYRQKFRKEAENLSKLDHSNIVHVLDVFDENNTTYYVMQYIDGQSLDEYILQQGCIAESKARAIVKEVGAAVQYMHSNKMLHLDLKPKNVMLDQNENIYLIDFGLSKQYDSKGEPESSTKVGAGTPGYAPIEQANYREGKGFPVTMDVYALGGTMFKMLTGVRPPEASDILNDGFPLYELQEHKITDSISASVAKAMAPAKKDRYQTVEDFLNSFEEEVTIIDIEKSTRLKSKKVYKNNDIIYYVNQKTSKVEISNFNNIVFGQVLSITDKKIEILSYDRQDRKGIIKIDARKYQLFLENLQSLKFDLQPEGSKIDPETTGGCWKISIRLFDDSHCAYANYWIAINCGDCGNISEDIADVNRKLERILKTLIGVDEKIQLNEYLDSVSVESDNKKDTPHLHDYVSSMHKEDVENASSSPKHTQKIAQNRGINMAPVIINDSEANPSLKFEVVGLSEKGDTPFENKDSLGWLDTQNGCIFVVCDGSYSNCKGNIASTIVSKSIVDYFQSKSAKSPKDKIIESIENAKNNLLIYNREQRTDLKSTCAVALLSNDKIYWGTVGNSRIYYYTAKSGLIQLSKDQSYVQNLMDSGVISQEEAYLHPDKDKDINLIGEGMHMPCIFTKSITPNNESIILLSSDGLTNVLESKEIARILASRDFTLEEKIRLMKELAVQKSNNDNITIVAVRLITTEKVGTGNKIINGRCDSNAFAKIIDNDNTLNNKKQTSDNYEPIKLIKLSTKMVLSLLFSSICVIEVMYYGGAMPDSWNETILNYEHSFECQYSVFEHYMDGVELFIYLLSAFIISSIIQSTVKRPNVQSRLSNIFLGTLFIAIGFLLITGVAWLVPAIGESILGWFMEIPSRGNFFYILQFVLGVSISMFIMYIELTAKYNDD